jgi:hypothetical protein
MTSPYLIHEENVSAVARCLRPLKSLDTISPLRVAIKTQLQLAAVERLLPDAIAYERQRRLALGLTIEGDRL